MKNDERRPWTPGCGCVYDEHDPWCPSLNQPPTERDGLSVGDDVVLIPHHQTPWPARIIAFLADLDCCMVVEWTGIRPFPSADRNLVCRKELAEVRPSAAAPKGAA